METTSLQRLGYLLLTIIGCFLVVGMLKGSVQNFISFVGVANEIGFTFILLLGTIYTGFMTIK